MVTISSSYFAAACKDGKVIVARCFVNWTISTKSLCKIGVFNILWKYSRLVKSCCDKFISNNYADLWIVVQVKLRLMVRCDLAIICACYQFQSAIVCGLARYSSKDMLESTCYRQTDHAGYIELESIDELCCTWGTFSKVETCLLI